MTLLPLRPNYLHRLTGFTAFLIYGKTSLLLFFALTACRSSTEHLNPIVKLDSVQSPTYAQGFAINYYQDFKTIDLISPTDTIRYLLLPNRSSPPTDISYDQIIRTPVERVITQSTTHLAFLNALNSTDKIIGLESVAYVYDSTIASRVAANQVKEVGSGNTLNPEEVFLLQPDLIFASLLPATGLSDYEKLIELDIPVLPISEWTESTPLGRAEWLKIFGALLDQEKLAQAKFHRAQSVYSTLSLLTQAVIEKPTVIVGIPFQGYWYVPGAQSYRNALLQDAGATWAFSRDSTAVSFPVNFERMYVLGLNADVWLDPGQIHTTREIRATDKRFADFPALQRGRVYNSSRRLNASGSGNDYYESGVVYPQRILADLIKILHPELMPHHQFYYYQRLP
ncbi:MAG: ABC transporter substrate-binding protein [Bacteroidota bacterium]